MIKSPKTGTALVPEAVLFLYLVSLMRDEGADDLYLAPVNKISSNSN